MVRCCAELQEKGHRIEWKLRPSVQMRKVLAPRAQEGPSKPCTDRLNQRATAFQQLKECPGMTPAPLERLPEKAATARIYSLLL